MAGRICTLKIRFHTVNAAQFPAMMTQCRKKASSPFVACNQTGFQAAGIRASAMPAYQLDPNGMALSSKLYAG